LYIPSKDQLKKVSKFKKMLCHEFTTSFLLEEESNLEAFLYSKVLFKFPRKERNILLKELEDNTQEPGRKLAFQYLYFSFGRADWFHNAFMKLIDGCSLENILSYFEFNLNRMIKKNTDIDGVNYPEEIIHSKHSFLLTVIPTVIYIFQRENLPVSSKKLLKDNDNSKLLLLMIAQYHSIRSQITEVMKGGYIPKSITHLDAKYGSNASINYRNKCGYFLQLAPENLDSIEIYRDLNDELERVEERDIDQSISLMKESGFIKKISGDKFVHFDMSKAQELEEVRDVKNIKKLIEKTYGSLDIKVSYKNLNFMIIDMVGLIKKIIKLTNVIVKHREKNCKHIFIYKQSLQELSKQLNLSELERDLLPLFVADFSLNNSSEIDHCPFFNVDNIYYMFLPITVELCYGKVVDKILSRKDIEFFLSYTEKGLLFEDKVINIFTGANFEVGKIKRNQKKKVPEIDAIVNFDKDNVLVIEAKCTIKPGGRLEVYSFVENHLSKASNQLLERVEFLTLNPNAANERLDFSIDNKKIIPIIVMNHSFFSGFKFVFEGDLVIYCIDELLLEMIISKGYVPTWEYTGVENNYVPKDRNLITKSEKLEAILDPVSNLYSKAFRTLQPLASGAVIEISKHPNIDRLEQFKRKADLQRV
jgi:hypothetical protein